MNWEDLTQFITQKNSYILQAFLVIFASLVLDFTQRKVLSRLHLKAEKTKRIWDDAIIDSLKKPASLIIWAVGIFFAMEIIHAATGAIIFKAVKPLRDTVIIGSIAWFLVRLIQHGEKKFVEGEKPADPTTVDAIAKLLKVSVVITSTLVILQTLGFSISGVVAFGGIGGMAVGFAAKDLLANFFGGLTIYLDRPFTVGDWVRSPDRDIEGTVEKIGWRLTCIRTFDKRPLYVPNSVFTTIAVENPSRMLNRRIKETVGIRYDDAEKMETIVSKIKNMIENHPDIDHNMKLIVNFNTFAPSSLDIFIYTFTITTNWVQFHAVKQDVLLKVINIIEEEGAEVAFPTSTLHLADKDIFKNIEPQT
ncbi:MAG: mechanosensitive ion channel family protein [Desulfobacterales bacterium]|nr:mechanosensitive ion channel family protein [Desulfobacterales bacterium]